MWIKYAGATASVLALAVLTAGCSSKTAAPNPATSEAITTPPASSVSTTAVATGLAIPVTILGGVVTPDNGEYEAKVGEPITINVDSDVADELHVHSVPEHEFEVKPGIGQNFTFTVTVPGQVVIELHKIDKTVATLTVR